MLIVINRVNCNEKESPLFKMIIYNHLFLKMHGYTSPIKLRVRIIAMTTIYREKI